MIKSEPTPIAAPQTELHKLFYARLPRRLNRLFGLWQQVVDTDWSPDTIDNLLEQVSRLYHSAMKFNCKYLLSDLSMLNQHLIMLDRCPPSPSQLELIDQRIQLLQNLHSRNQISDTPNKEHYILLLCQDGDWQDQLKEQLSDFDYLGQPITHAGLATAMQQPHAAALLVELGQDDDLALCQRLSELQATLPQPLPILFLSKQDAIQQRLAAVRAGGEAYFTPPYEATAIIEKLDKLLFPPESDTYRVLVVEDSRSQAHFITSVLVKEGMQVAACTEPLKLHESLQNFRPELILLDMYMPHCDGVELAKVIRQQPAYVSLPIVYLSAENDVSKQLNAMSMGGDDFLTKPIKPEHLISAVSTRIERYRTLRSLMIRDSLTGLLNHTNCMEHLEFEIACALRQKHTLCFAMLDIDHFKSVNDTHGHPTGDKVIKSLARLLTQRLRKSDIIGRYGGEEFAVVLPATPLDAAAEVLDNLRQRFERITQRSGDGAEFHVTFSCGIVELSADNGELLHELADKALYQAKTQGRNRVAKAPRAPTPFDNA